jgi:hypothetical protein
VPIEDYEDITFTERNIGRYVKAAATDTSAARRLIEIFVLAEQQGRAMPAGLVSYLAAAFRKIVYDNADPLAALNLKPRPRRPERADKWIRELRLALEVQERRDRGASYEQAVAEVADSKLGASKSTIERAYAIYKRTLNQLPTRKKTTPRSS